jgi:hypothetical protein
MLSPSRIEATAGTTCIDVMGAKGDDATSVGGVGVLLQLQPAATTRAAHSTTSRRDDAEMEVIPFLRWGGTLVDICSGCERHAPESIWYVPSPDHDCCTRTSNQQSSLVTRPRRPIRSIQLMLGPSDIKTTAALSEHHGRGSCGRR